MVSFDLVTLELHMISLITTFIIVTIIAYIALWALDKGTPSIPFEKIQFSSTAVAIASLGWILLYALSFVGSLIAPFSLNSSIFFEIIWTVFIVLVACELILGFIIFLSPYLRFVGVASLNRIGEEPISVAVFYLGLCILIGFISYASLTTRTIFIG